MYYSLGQEKSHCWRGTVAVLVTVVLLAILGFAALSVDVGVMYNARGDFQRAADSAALAAAS